MFNGASSLYARVLQAELGRVEGPTAKRNQFLIATIAKESNLVFAREKGKRRGHGIHHLVHLLALQKEWE